MERLVSSRLALSDVNSAFDRLAEGSLLRQLITFP